MAIPDNFPDRRICVLGLGYVGLTLAVTMADVGFDVFGVEIREGVLAMLARGEAPFFEPGLAGRLHRMAAKDRLHFSKRIPPNCPATVYIITVGTPLDQQGKSRMDMIENVSYELAGHLREGDLVILRSTVKIGTSRRVVLPILERSGVHFDLAFCPERTLEGKALGELRRLPQIVGGIDRDSEVRAAQIFQFLTPTIVRVSTVETAEMIKLIDNSYRDVTLAFGNEVARICDAIGISAIEVIRAGKLGYSRTDVAVPGPVGGPCLEKDPYILAESLHGSGIEPEIIMTARKLNERQPREIIQCLSRILARLPDFPQRPVISLLGIAFKGYPDTDDLRGTMAKPILEQLQHFFPMASFRGYDAVVSRQAIAQFGLHPCADIKEAFSGANLVMILNNHPRFAEMPLQQLAIELGRPALIYDFWNNFLAADLDLPERTGYMALGSHGCARLPE